LYANTKLGLWFYKRELKKAKLKLNNQPHSVTESFQQNGLCIALIYLVCLLCRMITAVNCIYTKLCKILLVAFTVFLQQLFYL